MSFQTQFTKDNWHREAATVAIRNNIRARRWGMRVTVYGDPTPANNGDWVLSYGLSSTDRQSNLNWLKVASIGATWGGGGGSSTAAKNQSFNTTGVESTFTVSNGTLDQINFVEVNGEVQRPTTDYTVAGQIVNFGSALPAGCTVVVYYYEGLSVGSPGGVQSVTGDGVDNTDPENPVLSYPTPGDIGAQAALGFTPENVANKATNFSVVDNMLYPSVQAVDTQKANRLETINTQVANYVLVLADANIKTVLMNVALSSNTVTIPPNSSVAFPVGVIITIVQSGTGQTAMVAGSGVTIQSSSGLLTSQGRYSPMVIEQVSADVWYLWNGPAAITGAALTRTNDTNITATLSGSPSSSLLAAVDIALGWTGTLAIARGGTGLSALGTALQMLRVNAAATALEFYSASGTYTPTLTNVLNLDASTAFLCTWIRAGNTVTVGGRVDLDPTAAGSVQLGISLPIASAFTTANQCGGTAAAPGIAGQVAAIRSDATNDRAELIFIAVDLTNQAMYFTFTYQVL